MMTLEQWIFMAQWCADMQAVFTATGSTATVWKWGPDFRPAIQFTIIPPRDSKSKPIEREQQLQTLREGLALFDAVAWIDADVLIAILKTNDVCRLIDQEESHMFVLSEIPAFVEIEVTRKLTKDSSTDFAWIHDDLVSLCCRLDEPNTSKSFQEAWEKLEAILGTTLYESQPLMGLEVPVRIVVGKPEYSKASGTASRRVWDVIKNVLRTDQIGWGWFSSFSAHPSTLDRRPKSSFYVSYVVDAINIPNARTLSGVSVTLMKLIADMSSDAVFSDLRLCLVPRRNSQYACRMISALLCDKASPDGTTTDQRGVTCFGVDVQDCSGLEMDGLLSALAVTRSCRAFTLTFSRYSEAQTKKMWAWLAYALFSHQSRSSSSVKEISIFNACLDNDILDSMMKILKANDSETELLAVCNKMEDLAGYAQDLRDYELRGDTTVQVYEVIDDRVVSWKYADIFKQKEAFPVVVINHIDISSKWVDALVPGIGFCKVQRSDLILCDYMNYIEFEPDLTLEIHFLELPKIGHLARFLRLIGKHLCCLWIHLPSGVCSKVGIPSIFKFCPFLMELALHNVIISAATFVWACTFYRMKLRRVECHFDDVRIITTALENCSTTLARTLCWWHCDLKWMPHVVSDAEALDALAQMLTRNKVLHYLTVVVKPSRVDAFRSGLMQFHLTILKRNGNLQIPSKLAFLSIFPSSVIRPPVKQLVKNHRRLCQLTPDTPVIKRIFAFAADCTVRKVNVISS
ncbi:unnamed protein product [Phytophthora fragariaefolia]|uniref:Unnamed protein product n=1 Tax=Phytophthora fragariaefolia TaxID=1490495 RepID=A0A9W6XFT3_9STRA|nr:unnamed protein product [Phytophthora fragariaefolia]